ncbi:PEP-CTERM sorting domain-containing protein [Aeoliella sp.]|uniref:PEP-CTERM sorting domain-containing protein n=1 Tax=Aeoliella sp. TaxID=2795800 RepID=UPI003CCBE2D6
MNAKTILCVAPILFLLVTPANSQIAELHVRVSEPTGQITDSDEIELYAGSPDVFGSLAGIGVLTDLSINGSDILWEYYTINDPYVVALEIPAGASDSIVIGPLPAGTYNVHVGWIDYSFRASPYVSGIGALQFTVAPQPGDFNADGTVNLADYNVWRDSLGATGLAPYERGDATGDGNVTIEDYDVWKSRFGQSSSGAAITGSEAVPEPSSLAIFVAAIWLLSNRRR